MTTIALLTALAFGTGLTLLSAATVCMMIRLGTIDMPGPRSSHTRPTPKGGGVGIVLAFLVGMMTLHQSGTFSQNTDPYLLAVILAACGIAAVAFLDDVLCWPAWIKLMAQLAAALLAVCGGLSLTLLRLPVIGTVQLGWLGPFVSIVWIVVATNALNFIDGLNGLASGVAAIACAVLVAIGGWLSAPFIYGSALVMLAGILGFLPFNFPRARIFMGDVGSQFCGFMLAVLAVAAGQLQAVDLSVCLVPMLLFGVLFDVGFTLLRRFLAGDRLAEAHRGHLYQLAQRGGMPMVWVTFVHWGFAAWGGCCCTVLLAVPSGWKPLCFLMVVPPQLVWLEFVAKQAKHAGIEGPALHWKRNQT